MAELLAIAAFVLIVTGALQPHLPSITLDESQATDGAPEGGIQVGEVYNNGSRAARIYVSPADERGSLVDPFVPYLEPGDRAGPTTLSCSSEYGTATHLTVQVRPAGETERVAEASRELDPSDCQPGGGTVFDITARADGNGTIERRE